MNYYPLLVFVLVPVILNLGVLRSGTSWKQCSGKGSRAATQLSTVSNSFSSPEGELEFKDKDAVNVQALIAQRTFPIIVIFLLSRLLLIGLHSQEYTDRVAYLRELTQASERQKSLIDPATPEKSGSRDLKSETLLMDWGLPYETLLQSATEAERPVTLLSLNEYQLEEKAELLKTDSLFVKPWHNFSYAAGE